MSLPEDAFARFQASDPRPVKGARDELMRAMEAGVPGAHTIALMARLLILLADYVLARP